jgi:hypothetical protein
MKQIHAAHIFTNSPIPTLKSADQPPIKKSKYHIESITHRENKYLLQFMHSTTIPALLKSPKQFPFQTRTQKKNKPQNSVSPHTLSIYSQPIVASKRSHMAEIPRNAEAGRFGFAQIRGCRAALAAHPMGEI